MGMVLIGTTTKSVRERSVTKRNSKSLSNNTRKKHPPEKFMKSLLKEK